MLVLDLSVVLTLLQNLLFLFLGLGSDSEFFLTMCSWISPGNTWRTYENQKGWRRWNPGGHSGSCHVRALPALLWLRPSLLDSTWFYFLKLLYTTVAFWGREKVEFFPEFCHKRSTLGVLQRLYPVLGTELEVAVCKASTWPLALSLGPPCNYLEFLCEADVKDWKFFFWAVILTRTNAHFVSFFPLLSRFYCFGWKTFSIVPFGEVEICICHLHYAFISS